MYNNINQVGGPYTSTPVYPQITPLGSWNNSYNPIQATTRNVLPGRTVEKVEDITIGEVPQDGSLGLFPQKDGSCIYAKMWNSDGTIRTMKFIPSEQDDSVPRQEGVQEATNFETLGVEILEKLDDVLDVLTGPNNCKPKENKKNQNGSD